MSGRHVEKVEKYVRWDNLRDFDVIEPLKRGHRAGPIHHFFQRTARRTREVRHGKVTQDAGGLRIRPGLQFSFYRLLFGGRYFDVGHLFSLMRRSGKVKDIHFFKYFAIIKMKFFGIWVSGLIAPMSYN